MCIERLYPDLLGALRRRWRGFRPYRRWARLRWCCALSSFKAGKSIKPKEIDGARQKVNEELQDQVI